MESARVERPTVLTEPAVSLEGLLRTLKNPHIPAIYPSSAKIQTPSIAAAAAAGPS
jgi:hypothetical protein